MITITRNIRSGFAEAYKTIKLPEVEEWFDIYFSRFFGYYLAKLSKFFGLTPNQVSLLSLFAAIIAGYFFYFQDQVLVIAFACFFITLSGLLDSADGQLARMTGQSSDLGRKIDAIIDTFAFVACYTGGALYFFPEYGWSIILIALVAGVAHSVKSAVYEFYKTEFIFYLKQDMGHRIPTVDEVKSTTYRGGFWKECLYHLEKGYISRQAFFVGRSHQDRVQFQEWTFGAERKEFIENYRKYNHSILTWWALTCGTNSHRTLMMICALFGRMDVYFLITIVTFFPMFIVSYRQNELDKKLLDVMKMQKVK